MQPNIADVSPVGHKYPFTQVTFLGREGGNCPMSTSQDEYLQSAASDS